MEKKVLEEILLELLDTSSALRERIKSICSGEQSENSNLASKPQKQLNFLEKRKADELVQANYNLKRYKDLYEKLNSKLSEYEREIESIKRDNKNLKYECDRYYSEIINKENENAELKSAINCERNKNDELYSELKVIKENNNELYNELEIANETVKKLNAKFKEPVNYLNLYRGLPESIRDGLYNVISDSNEIVFIASCTAEDNLKAIWNYIKDIIGDNYNRKDIDTLKNIFDYFFDVYNNSLSKPKYIRDDVNIGDYFDDEYYDRASGSLTSGPIKEIMLAGYKSRNTGRTVCKSLVRV